MTDEELLGEVEELIRNMPDPTVVADQDLIWAGRVKAVFNAWNSVQAIFFMANIDATTNPNAITRKPGLRMTTIALHQVLNELRLKTVGPINVAIGSGMTFDYFDNLRKIIELATSDILFVDPYMEAEFVSRYLPFTSAGVSIRLLAGDKKLAQLLPAVDMFTNQSGVHVQVRVPTASHDRFIFLDNNSCYHSSASFKDGARNASALVSEIKDAFAAMHSTYEALWNNARVER